MTNQSSFSNLRSFVRVRPFIGEEKTFLYGDCPVPREALLWNGKQSLKVLDPQNKFKTKTNGSFEFKEKILWSFEDSERSERKPCTQGDVYNAVVLPLIPSIVSGFRTAFLLTGAPGTGKFLTLYGFSSKKNDCGILPRFINDIFTAFQQHKSDNAELSCELEFVEIYNEMYFDLLNTRTNPPSRGSPNEIKLIPDHIEGVKLQGITRYHVSSPEEAINLINKASSKSSERHYCHTITFFFTETYVFDDPEVYGSVLKKERRTRVVFALLRSMPMTFHRCLNVAVERDSGVNEKAIVPTRECAFTRLYPDILTTNYFLNVITCVSPFVQHTKETMSNLKTALDIMVLKCNPQIQQDDALRELRRLQDEVKGLATEVKKTNESIEIVQQELNMREKELIKQEKAYQKTSSKLQLLEREVARYQLGAAIERYRSAFALESQKKILDKIRKEQVFSENTSRALKDTTSKLKESINETQKHKATIIKDSDPIVERNINLRERLEEALADEDLYELRIKIGCSNDEEEQVRLVSRYLTLLNEKELHIPQKTVLLEPLQQKIEKLKKQKKEFDGKDSAFVKSCQPISLNHHYQSQIEKTKNDIEQAETDITKMQNQTTIKTSNSPCCSVM